MLYMFLLSYCLVFVHIFCSGIEDSSGALKLQKDKERTKKERRKEKKREKKEGSRGESQILVLIEQSNKKRKHDERSQLNEKGVCYIKAGEDAPEQLERSGLTEESGPPSSVQNLYDSDSTQDHYKKQKLSHAGVSQQNHGTILRIRLPLVKHRDAETPKTKDILPPNDQPCFSVRVEAPQQRTVGTTLQQEASPQVVKHRDAERPKTEVSKSLSSNDQPCFSVRVEPPVQRKTVGITLQREAAAQTVKHRDAETPKMKVSKSLHSNQPCFSVRVEAPVQRKAVGTTLQQEAATQKVKLRDAETLKAKESEQLIRIDEPCFSGRVEAPVQREAVGVSLQQGAAQTVHRDAILEGSRRTRKMEKKFRDLIVNWNPPAMELERADTDDLDWLVGGREQKGNPSTEKCNVKAEGLCHGNPACSLEPRACYLPEVDMYALPYVVPF